MCLINQSKKSFDVKVLRRDLSQVVYDRFGSWGFGMVCVMSGSDAMEMTCGCRHLVRSHRKSRGISMST